MGKIIKFPSRKKPVEGVIAGTTDQVKERVEKITGNEPNLDEIKTAGPFRVFWRKNEEKDQNSSESKGEKKA